MNEIETYEDFLPKTAKTPVGDRVLIVSELTIAQRDAVVNKLLGSHDMKGMFGEIRKAVEKSGKEVGVDETATTIFDLVSKLLGGDLTHVACVVLDTPENMKIVLGDKPCAEDTMKNWIRSSMTARQEQKMLQRVFEVNDFASLAKNYVTLVVNGLGVGEGTEDQGQTSP